MRRGLFVAGPLATVHARAPNPNREQRLIRRLKAFLRRAVFDRFGRS